MTNNKFSKYTSFLPSFSGVVFVVFFAGIIFFFNEIKDYDFWWHLAAGKFISSSHLIPRFDIFSFIADGKKWISHEWLSGFLFYKIYFLFNFKGILILKALIISSILALLFNFLIKDKKINVFLSLFLILLAAASYVSMWTERPYHFTIFFSLLFLIILEKNKGKVIFFLPLLMLLWVNLHGGFIIGFILLGIYLFDAFLERNFKNAGRLFLIFILCFFTALINPHGQQSFYFPFSYMGKEVIKEWAPAKILNEPELLIYFFLIFISLFMSRREKENRFLLISIIFMFLALTARRNVPLFSILITPFLGVHLQEVNRSVISFWRKTICFLKGTECNLKQTVSEAERAWTPTIRRGSEAETRAVPIPLGSGTACLRRLLPSLLVIILTIFFIIFYLKNNRIKPIISENRYPLKAVEFLKQNNLLGNLYNPYNWGGFLIWHLYPKYKVFVDSRADLYGQEIITDAVNIERGIENWSELLKKYNIKYILVPSASGLEKILKKQKVVKIIYKDDLAIIYEKRVNP